MSYQAVEWAFLHAPIPDDEKGVSPKAATLVAVLAALAHHAEVDGSAAFPSVKRMAGMTHLSERVIPGAVERLRTLGLIKPGREVAKWKKLRADNRPKIWDLQVKRHYQNCAECIRQEERAKERGERDAPRDLNPVHPVGERPEPDAPRGMNGVPERGEPDAPEESLKSPKKSPLDDAPQESEERQKLKTAFAMLCQAYGGLKGPYDDAAREFVRALQEVDAPTLVEAARTYRLELSDPKHRVFLHKWLRQGFWKNQKVAQTGPDLGGYHGAEELPRSLVVDILGPDHWTPPTPPREITDGPHEGLVQYGERQNDLRFQARQEQAWFEMNARAHRGLDPITGEPSSTAKPIRGSSWREPVRDPGTGRAIDRYEEYAA
ncbi:hypothetical protein H4696_008454 [Amycolatopsis lexingtonensis]|uniref:Helix-turn-helix domain-containing protein n=1 Tax=Amycolatopsis lexingtonensis TaxID=218822 RepID=A0ABR9IDU7_9PSEU|nr:hypothetical protein [Amycolatopsis lexingtonensis]MBE1501354.1 hypothetical protein [Amycolatopsis lexingtonensis]